MWGSRDIQKEKARIEMEIESTEKCEEEGENGEHER